MANALKGKSTVFMTFIAPNSDAAETLRLFFENHFEFIDNKFFKKKDIVYLSDTILGAGDEKYNN